MARSSKLNDALPSLGRTLRVLWPWIRPQRPLMAASLTALFASVGLKLLEPWPLKWVFDSILRHRTVNEVGTALALAAGSVVGITALRALAEYFCSVGFALAGNRVLTEVRVALFQHLQRLSLSYHAKARGGDLTVRVVGDVNMLKDVAASAILPLVANVLILVGMAVLMAILEWRLALLALAPVPLYWLSSIQLTKKIREASRQQRAREGEMAAAAAESLAAIKDVQALSLEHVFGAIFSGRSRKSFKESVRTARLTAMLERRVDVIGAAAAALVLYFGARMVLAGSLSPGELIVFLAYLKRSVNPLQDFAKYTGRLAKAAAAGERVLGVLGCEPEVRDARDAVPAGPLRGDIQFDKVAFAYDAGHPVLRDINLAIPAGTSVAVVGPSGIGKSTLCGLLLRLIDPVAGQVLIDGRDAREVTLASLRSQMSVVLQDGLLFAASIRENVACASASATAEEVEAACRLAGAHEFIARLPSGYETILGERGVTLSHGQRQRVAIARAAIRQAPILILDEPTTGLDEECERSVVAALERLREGRTTLLVTHDLRLAARCDRVMFLEHGHVAEFGTHGELLSLDGRYAAVYRLQVETAGGPHALAG